MNWSKKAVFLIMLGIHIFLFSNTINALCEEVSYVMGSEGSYLESIAVNTDLWASKALFDSQPDEEIMILALESVLSPSTSITKNEADGTYSFPFLEVGHTAIVSRSTLLQTQDETDVWIISFFPEKVPQMAACVVIAEDGEVIEVFHNSTWMMQKCWEKALGVSGYLWPINTRYVFHMLFEPEDMWNYAALPLDPEVSEEQAKETANSAIIGRYFSNDQNKVSQYTIVSQYNISKKYDSIEIWSIHYYFKTKDGFLLQYSVDIDSTNGTVLDVRKNENGLG